MKLQNAHPLNPSSFRIILQFHSVKIRKNTREEYIDSDAIYIYIYTLVTRRQILPLGKIVEEEEEEDQISKEGKRRNGFTEVENLFYRY